MNKWLLKQPGFIDWNLREPITRVMDTFSSTRSVEWDGTMNMPVMDLADKEHKHASRIWNLH